MNIATYKIINWRHLNLVTVIILVTQYVHVKYIDYQISSMDTEQANLLCLHFLHCYVCKHYAAGLIMYVCNLGILYQVCTRTHVLVYLPVDKQFAITF